MQSHSYLSYRSIGFEKSKGPGTLNEWAPYFNMWW